MKNTALKKHFKYMVPQVKVALVKEPGEPIQISTPDDIAPFLEPLRHAAEEYFVAFHLDARLQVTGFCEVSHGTTSMSLVHPREVFKAAILSNAYAIIVAHNHPAGSVRPSPEDIQTTKSLVKAGELMQIHVLDHFIVTDKCTVSLRELDNSLFQDLIENVI